MTFVARAIEDGMSPILFPEGKIGTRATLHRGRTGLVRVAHAAGVPIVPVGVIDTPASSARPESFVAVAIGEPLHIDRPAEGSLDRSKLRQLTDQIMYSLRELTGYDYVDTYVGHDTAIAGTGGDTNTSHEAAEVEHSLW